MAVKLVALAAGLALAGTTTPAQAAAPVFTAPVAVGSSSAGAEGFSGSSPFAAILGADGSATIAWPAVDRGVQIAERPPGGGPFAEPHKISDDAAPGGIEVVSNEAGLRAMAWTDYTDLIGTDKGTAPLEIAVALPGQPFGAQEEVPLPPPAPVTDPGRNYSRTIGPSHLAVTADGAVLVSYLDNESQSQRSRPVTVLRLPDGSWTEPQVLDEYAYRPPSVAADATGLHAIWATPPHGASDQRIRVLYTADAGLDGHFGEAYLLSEPDRDADNGGRGPQFVTNRRGDMLVAWGQEWFNYQVEAAFRPAGGAWQAPRVISEGVPNSMRPTAALDERGDAVVAWTNGVSAYARFRPAGGDWGPASDSFARQGTIDTMPVALDPEGNGLIVSAVARSAGTVDSVAAFELPRGEKLGPALTVATGDEPVSPPAVATDSFGNGLVVWLSGRYQQPSTVHAASYSGRPPAVTAFRVKRSAFTLRVNEPARVTVVVRGRRRHTSESARVRRGATTLPFGPKVRALLMHHGRYRATIRARDPGPRASRPRTVHFKR